MRGDTVDRLACRSLLAVVAGSLLAVLPTTAASGAAKLCGATADTPPAARYRHVVVIMDENKSFSDIIGPKGSPARRHAPFLNHVAAACGLATNYRGITHPSHPNYMAVTGGVRPVAASEGPNIFRQVRRSGRSWRVYNPSMRHHCQRRAAYPYKPGHNPGIAWLRVAEDCRRWDVGGRALADDIARHRLPAYAFIAPDQCHNMHASCVRRKGAVRAGDDWLRNWVTRLAHLPSYTAGRTVIFITWDEGSRGQGAEKRGENCLLLVHLRDESCHVPTLVVSAEVRPGTRSHRPFSHYSLLRTTERLLGYSRYIGHANDPLTRGMRLAFGL